MNLPSPQVHNVLGFDAHQPEDTEKDQQRSDGLALEELRLLQAVIQKHDDLRSAVVNWAVGLVTALCAVYLSDKSGLSRTGFLGVGTTVATLFFWLDAVYKVAQDRAIRRSADVEALIRRKQHYDGPRIGESLVQPNSIGALFKAANNVRVWFPFVILVVLVWSAAFIQIVRSS